MSDKEYRTDERGDQTRVYFQQVARAALAGEGDVPAQVAGLSRDHLKTIAEGMPYDPLSTMSDSEATHALRLDQHDVDGCGIGWGKPVAAPV